MDAECLRAVPGTGMFRKLRDDLVHYTSPRALLILVRAHSEGLTFRILCIPPPTALPARIAQVLVSQVLVLVVFRAREET